VAQAQRLMILIWFGKRSDQQSDTASEHEPHRLRHQSDGNSTPVARRSGLRTRKARTMLTQLWNDETGAVLTVELLLICSIVGLGVITGLSTVRDALITELADVAAAVANIDQGFSVAGIESPTGFSAGFEFIDQRDPGDVAGAPAHPRGIIVCTAPQGESMRLVGGPGPATHDTNVVR